MTILNPVIKDFRSSDSISIDNVNKILDEKWIFGKRIFGCLLRSAFICLLFQICGDLSCFTMINQITFSMNTPTNQGNKTSQQEIVENMMRQPDLSATFNHSINDQTYRVWQ